MSPCKSNEVRIKVYEREREREREEREEREREERERERDFIFGQTNKTITPSQDFFQSNLCQNIEIRQIVRK